MTETPSTSSYHGDNRIRFTPDSGGEGELRRPQVQQKRATDATNDKASAAFVRRTLCAHHIQAAGEKGRNTPKPIEELLPPLTSSNEIDLELYAFIAIIVKDYIYAWYTKFTPDHVFVDDVIQIIAHCTRALEQRLRKVDLEALLLDEIPKLVDDHIIAFTTASETSQHYPLATKPRQIYHSLQPHPALSPVPDVSNPILIQEQQENEATWRQLLVQGMLAVLLPTEDLENGCLRALVAEIFSELILGNGICGRACENWLLWEATIKIVETLQHRRGQGRSVDGQTQQGPSRLERFGLLSPKEELLKPVKSSGKDRLSTISVSALFWMLVQYAFLAFTAMRAMLVMLVSSSSLPLRRTKSISHPSDADPHREDGADGNNDTEKRPIVSMDIWSAVSHLVELQQRMPWLSGFLGLLHWGAVSGMWKVANTDGVLDRILADQIRRKMLNADALPMLLRVARTNLFPNNSLAPPRATPDAEQALQIRQQAAEAVIDALPSGPVKVYLATADRAEAVSQVEKWLDTLGDQYLNKHLVIRIVELVVVRLVPEMGQRGVSELLEERLGNL